MISTDASPERVKKIADFVNENLKLITEKAKTTVPYNAAILAALNIAEKYFDVLEKQSQLKTNVMQRSKKLMELLDASSGKE